MLTSLEPLLEGKRMVICAGSGGVGKTTTAAAVALGLAERGKKVAVVTIDPAKRLATALGLDELGNAPHRVPLQAEGELWAMMLDAKRTFDELIERLAPDERTRDEVFANRIYQQLSSAVAGSQEFTAIAKLYELDQSAQFDVLVLDTPPWRNALDFLDAPGRLTRFFQGRAIRMFLKPAGLLGRGTGLVFSVMRKVTGVDLLQDLSGFFRSLSGMIDGFTERARRVGALLEDPATTFLIVTAPRHDPVEEAIFFHRKLREAGMPFGGLVVNRVHQPPDDALPEPVAIELGPALAERVSAAAAQLGALAARDAGNVARLRSRLGDPPTLVVPELDGDVHDLDGLAAVRAHLFREGSP
ncbi:arsenite efflux ATP-binding protein ArsA [Solirubrobacter pauli]|uniref:Arsenite efflux ATP-binding protein ArsA n=1 Tax=Solirubrobacter pauli TaxID=166793 RepID=A0A660L8P8_9ACTN|nr:ArsA family ATPase [Solirubrobacter pauli]RKQ91388.1 arsenite efflux ATP-binding protein ArsA [Solirubrobacter pauli]